ncbi:MAG: hypothetical protein K5767_02880 [Clostridia bacterium]|nr:hypothetical protein [Clostridia bacterium]
MKKIEFAKSHKTITAIVAVLVMALGGIAVYAATPGSDSDPVVTKSYVDQAISAAISNAGYSSGGTTSGSSGTFSVVHLDQGQKILGAEGTEIILRSGEATAIDNGSNGVSDLTSGEDLTMGKAIQTNHLLLVPRNDGRGLAMSTEAYLMVRGGYTLK